MAEANTEAQIAEAQKLEDLTGMGVPAEDLIDTPEDKPEVKPEAKPESKPEDKPEEGESKDEDKDEEEDETDDEDEGRTVKQPEKRPAKSERPLKAAFSQIKELRGVMDQILTKIDNLPQAKQAAVEAVDDSLTEIMKEAEEKGADPAFIQKLIEKASEKMMKDLEKSGALKRDLPPEVQEKLKLLDKVQEDIKQKEEINHFEKEWNNLIPELQKQFPNAKAGELAEAKKIMDELSHSKDFHKYDLDYVLFKNRSKFETILKVAKNTKSGEADSKEIRDYSPDEDIDLDPENMTPDKMKAYQKRKLAEPGDTLEIMG